MSNAKKIYAYTLQISIYILFFVGMIYKIFFSHEDVQLQTEKKEKQQIVAKKVEKKVEKPIKKERSSEELQSMMKKEFSNSTFLSVNLIEPNSDKKRVVISLNKTLTKIEGAETDLQQDAIIYLTQIFKLDKTISEATLTFDLEQISGEYLPTFGVEVERDKFEKAKVTFLTPERLKLIAKNYRIKPIY